MSRTSVQLARSVENMAASMKKNKITVLVSVLFFAGMLYGALLIGFGEKGFLDSLGFMTKGYADGRTGQTVLTTFFNSFVSAGTFILLLFLLGFSAISAPLILFLPFFRGLGLGASIGYLYTAYGLKGVAFCAAIILPAALFSTFAVILAGREALKLSFLFLSAFIPKMKGEISPRAVKLYCVKFLVLMGIILISALIDCGVTFLFSGFLVL